MDRRQGVEKEARSIASTAGEVVRREVADAGDGRGGVGRAQPRRAPRRGRRRCARRPRRARTRAPSAAASATRPPARGRGGRARGARRRAAAPRCGGSTRAPSSRSSSAAVDHARPRPRRAAARPPASARPARRARARRAPSRPSGRGTPRLRPPRSGSRPRRRRGGGRRRGRRRNRPRPRRRRRWPAARSRRRAARPSACDHALGRGGGDPQPGEGAGPAAHHDRREVGAARSPAARMTSSTAGRRAAEWPPATLRTTSASTPEASPTATEPTAVEESRARTGPSGSALTERGGVSGSGGAGRPTGTSCTRRAAPGSPLSSRVTLPAGRGEQRLGALGPLHQHQLVVGRELRPAQLPDLLRLLQPVEVQVRDLHAARRGVAEEEVEGRRGHRPLDPRPARHRPRQRASSPRPGRRAARAPAARRASRPTRSPQRLQLVLGSATASAAPDRRLVHAASVLRVAGSG